MPVGCCADSPRRTHHGQCVMRDNEPFIGNHRERPAIRSAMLATILLIAGALTSEAKQHWVAHALTDATIVQQE